MAELPFNWADWIIIAVTLFSMLISVIRGFVREALSLATWVAAFLVARIFTPELEPRLVDYIETPSVRMAVAFAALFFATLIAGSIINFLIGQLVKATGLSGTDRLLGIVFGFARGVVLFVVAVALLKLTPAPRDPWWGQSVIIPHLEIVEDWSRQNFGDILEGLEEKAQTAVPVPGTSQQGNRVEG